MTRPIVIAGTDTDAGKTVFAAALTGALNRRGGAHYWKPVQAGFDPYEGRMEGDADRAARLGGIPADRVLPEVHRLQTPCSPHLAAEIDGVAIDPDSLTIPQVDGPLVIEMAGGLMVPLTREVTFLDVIARWKAPTVLVARTALGTINHSLLTIEALRQRDVPLIGVAFMGEGVFVSEGIGDSERTICDMGKTRRLGRIDRLDPLNAETLAAAFDAGFKLEDFL
ncbi:MAG: dethiobiotin synthase [Croceicoccus sp.]|nr:dethiobiotin synthase [Croceicoccus sp.]|tara:strand:- start:107037 stop:107708 length:672 start_codon:yes stop_codon:yes gene_type:complete